MAWCLMAPSLYMNQCKVAQHNDGFIERRTSDNLFIIDDGFAHRQVLLNITLILCFVVQLSPSNNSLFLSAYALQIQVDMMTSSNGIIFLVTGLLCVEFTGHRWIPRTKPVMFSLICVWNNSWVNNGGGGDLRRYRVHYDVIVMINVRHSHCPLHIGRDLLAIKTLELWINTKLHNAMISNMV